MFNYFVKILIIIYSVKLSVSQTINLFTNTNNDKYILTINNTILPKINKNFINYENKYGYIYGSGYPNSTITLFRTNYLLKTDSRNSIQNQYINLGISQYGSSNPTTDYKNSGYSSNYIINAKIINGTIETNSYLSEQQKNGIKNNVSALYVVADGCFIALKKYGVISSFGTCTYPNNVITDVNIVKVETSMRGTITLNTKGKIKNYGPYGGGENFNDEPNRIGGYIFKNIWAGGYAMYAGLTTTNTLIVWGYGLNGQCKYYHNTNVKQIKFTYEGGGYIDNNYKLELWGNTDLKLDNFEQIISVINVDINGNWNYKLDTNQIETIQNTKSEHIVVKNCANKFTCGTIIEPEYFKYYVDEIINTNVEPRQIPSSIPTSNPSSIPSSIPNQNQSLNSASNPSSVLNPSSFPSSIPSSISSSILTIRPSQNPTTKHSQKPTIEPSQKPTIEPSQKPIIEQSKNPTTKPSQKPSQNPTIEPSQKPIIEPSKNPTTKPSQKPSQKPIIEPSKNPTTKPSQKPSQKPTTKPSQKPTTKPSQKPTTKPSQKPTTEPSQKPTTKPSQKPTTKPSFRKNNDFFKNE